MRFTKCSSQNIWIRLSQEQCHLIDVPNSGIRRRETILIHFNIESRSDKKKFCVQFESLISHYHYACSTFAEHIKCKLLLIGSNFIKVNANGSSSQATEAKFITIEIARMWEKRLDLDKVNSKKWHDWQ